MSKKELELAESKQQPQPKDQWSEDGQIFFHYGKGYSLTENLKTICLGSENDIEKFFATGEINNELNPTQVQVLTQIQEYRREEGIGESNTGTGSLQRGSHNGASRRKQKATRHLTARKRLSLHLSLKKSKSLPR